MTSCRSAAWGGVRFPESPSVTPELIEKSNRYKPC